MFCTNCGRENPDSNKFCLQCGQPLAAKTTQAGPTAAAPTSPRRSLGRLPLILGGVALLAALAAGAWILLPRLTGGGGGREMLLAAPNRDGTYDILVSRLGDDSDKAIIIAKSVPLEDSAGIGEYLVVNSYHEVVELRSLTEAGGFLPGTDRLIVPLFEEDGHVRIMEYRSGDEAPIEVWSGDTDEFYLAFFEGSSNLFLGEVPTGSTNPRCYLLRSGQEAERVARADNCMPTIGGTHIVAEDYNNRGELTITVTNVKNDKETILLDDADVQGFDAWSGVSADGSHAVYRAEGSSVVLVNDTGKEVFRSKDFDSVTRVGFIGQSNDIYYIVIENDTYSLYTANGGPWIEAPALNVLPAVDGKSIAVITADENGEGEVSVINAANGAVGPILTGEGLAIAWAEGGRHLLIKREIDDDLVLIATDPSGANPVTLFDDSGYTLANVPYGRIDGKYLLLGLRDEDNLNSFYAAPLDGNPGFFVLQEWAYVELADISNETLLFAGQEDLSDDDMILYSRKLSPEADTVEIDDMVYAQSASIASDGRTAVYSMSWGDGIDDTVVRRTPLDGKGKPEDMLDGVGLAWQWAPTMRYSWLSWESAGTPLMRTNE